MRTISAWLIQSVFVTDILLWLRRAAVDDRTSGSVDEYSSRGRVSHINLRGCHTSPSAGPGPSLLHGNIKPGGEVRSSSPWSWSWAAVPLCGQKRNRLSCKANKFNFLWSEKRSWFIWKCISISKIWLYWRGRGVSLQWVLILCLVKTETFIFQGWFYMYRSFDLRFMRK